MTSTTFDGSSGPSPAPRSTPAAPAPTGEATAWGATLDADAPDALLDQLRARVEERNEADPQEWTKEVPKVWIRLVCDPDIENGDFQRWTNQAMPRKGRTRGRAANPMAMDQLALAARALTATNIRLELKGDSGWRPMTGRDGDVLTLESDELLRTFNVMDSTSVLRKLFGRDARVIDAGQELLAEAGYLGDDTDPDDPA
jgi:hypothetical protein